MKKTVAFTGALGVCLLLVAGCATNAPRAGVPDQFGYAGPPENRVLWQYRTALMAMRAGDYDRAKALLDDAILTMGGVLAHDPSARRARGLFSAEARKNFIGEPYERVMAYYYRGILYWMDGEPDNARACFRSAQIMDADADHREYAADYALLDYLDGFATVKLSGDGSDAFKRAQGFSRAGALPPYNRDANVLFFVEYGNGPVKYATGRHAEQLRFRPGRSAARSAVLKVGSQTIPLPSYDDLYFQATTRGGRVMDHVLANKAVFKSTTEVAGTAAIISGAVLAHNRNTQEIGLGLLAAGVLTSIVSASTTPAADTRMWNNLPQFLSFAAVPLPPGEHKATVDFKDANGRVLSNLTQAVTLRIDPSGGDIIVFVSDKS
jgi:hypothetical protein